MGPLPLLWVFTGSWLAAKPIIFLLFAFFHKAKILFRFLSVSENRYQCKSSIEVKWPKVNFQKLGTTVILKLNPTL